MKKIPNILRNLGNGVITIGVVYLAFGLAWITFSDALVQIFFADADVATINAIQTYKGYAYVTLTSLLLVILLGNFALRMKNALKLQQEADNTLKKLVEEVGVGIARLNLQGQFEYANPDCCRFFGYTEEELLNKNVFDLTHPDDHDTDAKCWAQLLARETNDVVKEKRFLNKQNQINWAQEKVTLVEDSNRDPNYVVLVLHNINSLKKAEAELAKSISYYQTILNNSFDGVAIVDSEGLVKYQTPSVERITGHSLSDRVGKSAFTHLLAEDLPKMQAIFGQLVKGSIKEARTVLRYHNANNELRYLDVYVKNMLADELINGLVVNFRDVTDKYQIEHKLMESEEQYKLLFLHNPIPVFIYDPKTLNYLQVNEAAINNYGYTREEFLNMNLKDIRPKEDIEKVLEDIAKLESGVPETNKIWRHITKAGELKYVEISSIYIHYNGKKARMSIANDVTHIMNNQENIRQSEERYRHLVEHLPAGAVLVQGNQLYYNKAVAEITGYTSEEINTLDEWFAKLYKDDAKLIRKYYEEDKLNHFKVARTVSITNKFGIKKWITFYAYRYDTGEVWLIQDVTEQKKMDELIINSILEGEERERKRLADQLHDGIGNLLVSANFKLEALKDQWNELPEPLRTELETCHSYLNKAITQTRNMATGLIPLSPEHDDLVATLKNTFLQFQAISKLKIEFEHQLNVPIASPSIANNLYRISQEALSNILQHAEAGQIKVTLVSNQMGLTFTIQDNGKGLSPSTKTGAPQGNGLRNIQNRVKAMGGYLELTSQPNQGTTLEVTVPYNA